MLLTKLCCKEFSIHLSSANHCIGYAFIQCYAVVVPVQNANIVKITDFGLAKLLDADQDVFKAVGGKVC